MPRDVLGKKAWPRDLAGGSALQEGQQQSQRLEKTPEVSLFLLREPLRMTRAGISSWSLLSSPLIVPSASSPVALISSLLSLRLAMFLSSRAALFSARRGHGQAAGKGLGHKQAKLIVFRTHPPETRGRWPKPYLGISYEYQEKKVYWNQGFKA